MVILDNILLRRGIEALQTALPAGWTATLKASPHRSSTVPRVMISAPDGRKGSIDVYPKRRLGPRDVVAFGTRAAAQGASMMVASYISPATRERLREFRIGYIDLAGSIWLTLANPGLVIDVRGADTKPDRIDRAARSLKGPKAGGVVRALADLSLPLGVRALAAAAGVDPGYASRLLSFLAEEALVERADRGGVVRVDRGRLLRRWASDAPFPARGCSAGYLEPRGLPALIAKLRTRGLRHAVTGSLAAERLAPVAAPRLAVIYVEDSRAAALALGLRPADAGANVMLVEPVDHTVFARTEAAAGVNYVALSQVAADLLGGPGRGPEEAEALLALIDAKQTPRRG